MNRFEMQCGGLFIEVYFDGELLAEFEYLGKVFLGADYSHHFKENTDARAISEGYKISDEITPKELIEMLEEWDKNYSVEIVGLPMTKQRFGVKHE